jgi:putative oxidoreductase
MAATRMWANRKGSIGENGPQAVSKPTLNSRTENSRTLNLERLAILYARIALGAAFLSAVADRFGLWGKYGGWGNFANFETYTAQVISFMPAFVVPFIAWAATVAELFLGAGLILGLWPRQVALGAAALLFLFGTAMAISFGIKSPLDYSVISASAGAVLLGLYQGPKSGVNS